MGATGDVQGLANEVVDSAQRLANETVDLAEDAAATTLGTVLGAIRLLTDTAEKLGQAVVGK